MIFDLEAGAVDEQELKERTRYFALRVIKLVDAIPNSVSGRAIANQWVRAGTSVGANDRSACRGRSKAQRTYRHIGCLHSHRQIRNRQSKIKNGLK